MRDGLRRNSVTILTLACILLLPAAALSGGVRFIWGDLQPGNHAVGLNVSTFADTTGRLLDIVRWYPAAAAKSRWGMTFAGYLALSEGQADISRAHLRNQLASEISSDPATVDRQTLDRILDSRMVAIKEAAPLKGHFPLLVWSAHHRTVAAQSVLSEFLASHGYVVVFIRPHEGPLLPPYQIASREGRTKVLEQNVRDMEAGVRHLQAIHVITASTSIGVLSWSYAGESAALFQMRNPEVRLVVGLSSNVLDGWVYQEGGLQAADRSKLNVPYVVMREEIGANGKPRPMPPVLDHMPVSSYFVRFNQLAHGNFNVLEGMIPARAGISSVVRWSTSGPAGQLGYETIARTTLHFVDSFVKQNVVGSDPLENWDWNSGLPEHFVQISRHGGI